MKASALVFARRGSVSISADYPDDRGRRQRHPDVCRVICVRHTVAVAPRDLAIGVRYRASPCHRGFDASGLQRRASGVITRGRRRSCQPSPVSWSARSRCHRAGRAGGLATRCHYQRPGSVEKGARAVHQQVADERLGR
jgi:hypothetical protein